MDESNFIDTLNDLIEVNNKRLSRYREATRSIKNLSLKNFFSKCSSVSVYFSYQLSCLARGFGAVSKSTDQTNEPVQELNRNASDILTSCEGGDKTTLEVYDRILSESEPSLFPADIWEIICLQRYQIERSIESLKALLNNFVLTS